MVEIIHSFIYLCIYTYPKNVNKRSGLLQSPLSRSPRKHRETGTRKYVIVALKIHSQVADGLLLLPRAAAAFLSFYNDANANVTR